MKKQFIILFVITFFVLGSIYAGDKDETKILTVDTSVDPDSWVLIPAGDFFSGPHNHPANIDYDFEMMLTDVTNAQYAAYLNEALAKGVIKIAGDEVVGYHPGDPFDGFKHEFEIKAGDWVHFPINKSGVRISYDGQSFSAQKGFENHPVVMVTWFGAKSYADYYGWRLPTEKEWAKAARGTDTRSYPWGDDFGMGRANFYSSHDLFEKMLGNQGGTTPVGFYNGKNYDGFQTESGASPYGLYDMAGNVWQWVGDDYPDVHYRYLRGGSLANYEQDLRVWARNSAGPDHYDVNIGFRCARDKQKEEIPEPVED